MEILKPYRAQIDALDDQIIDLLAARCEVIRTVGELKARENIPAVLQDRVDEVRERCADRAAQNGVDADVIRQIYTLLIDYSCQLEERIAKK
jgi:chorismate mutase